MTDDDSPVDPFFELQRNTIKQTEKTLDSVFKMSTMFGDAFAQGVEPTRELQQQTIELSRQSIHTSLDAVQATNPNTGTVEELRAAVDDAFDTLADQTEALSHAVEDGYDSIDDEAVENLQDQIELLIELNETVEQQLVDALERFADRADRSEELVEGVEDQVERLSERIESQSERLEEMSERLEDIDFAGGDGDGDGNEDED